MEARPVAVLELVEVARRQRDRADALRRVYPADAAV